MQLTRNAPTIPSKMTATKNVLLSIVSFIIRSLSYGGDGHTSGVNRGAYGPRRLTLVDLDQPAGTQWAAGGPRGALRGGRSCSPLPGVLAHCEFDVDQCPDWQSERFYSCDNSLKQTAFVVRSKRRIQHGPGGTASGCALIRLVRLQSRATG
jgi:hypothetical protein